MINSVIVTNSNGEMLKLEMKNPEKSGFFIKRIDGLGPTKSVINMNESLWLDGSYFNSARSIYRNLVLELGFMSRGDITIEELRHLSYRIFRNKRQITIDIETDTRSARTIGYVESNEPNIFSSEESTIISVICPDAYFYALDFVDNVFSGVSSTFSFPFQNNSTVSSLIKFGDVFLNTTNNIYYDGDEPTGIFIAVSFYGTVTNPSFNNVTTGQSMVLSGSMFISGDELYISTLKGQKTIILLRNGEYYNIINNLTSSSKWITIDTGDNVFEYTAETGITDMLVYTRHKLVYGGL